MHIERVLSRRLLGLYLFGSLAAGDFVDGKSDLDLWAVVDGELSDADIDELRAMHEGFETARPDWRDRVEVAYVSRAVLATFAATPTGTIARISPGEPLHLRELNGDLGWRLDWHAVVAGGETIIGRAPATLGPAISDEMFRDAVVAQLHELQGTARENTVAYVPAQQGYIVATVCRGLYALATGRQTSKETAVGWFAERHPQESEFVWAAYRAYRADLRGPHEQLISFVDSVAAEADQLA